MTKIIGYDGNGIPRVFAEDDYEQTAYGYCREEAAAYINRRPDTGPLSAWRFAEDGEPTTEPTEQGNQSDL